ncbi:MAG: alpha/beta hydrolase [Solirubrobacteraceae bacterium]|nr:alpha/beta hydrolase [Solirubrobacteraceae bacterium]
MSRIRYAEELSRVVDGGLVERTFGPGSPRSQRMARSLRFTVRRTVGLWRPTSRGIKLARLAFDPGQTWPPLGGTRFQTRKLGGVKVEWSVAPRAAEHDVQDRVILYFHGGGFVVGSPRTHRNLVSRLSHVTATPIASVDYGMVPEASIQASRSDALAAYKGLIESGYPAETIIVAGDSAGGNLAAYVALAAADRDLGLPAALVLLSPWADLTTVGGSRHANAATEFFLAGDVLDRIARVLVPDEAERAAWPNSPINAPAELLRLLPPTLIQVGADEALLDDGITLARRIGAAGGTVELQTYEGQGHVVALWAGNVDARRATREIAVWIDAALPEGHGPGVPPDDVVEEAVDAQSPVDIARQAFPG